MTKKLIAEGRKHDEAMRHAQWSLPASSVVWLQRNMTALLDGYAAALDELGHATAHDGDHLSKASRAMVDTVMGDRERLRSEVLRLTEELSHAKADAEAGESIAVTRRMDYLTEASPRESIAPTETQAGLISAIEIWSREGGITDEQARELLNAPAADPLDVEP